MVSGQGFSLVLVCDDGVLPPILSTLLSVVPSSASWRIPLAIQLIPGAILGLGCFFLPPSPRLLTLHGRYDDALESLARLRMRTLEEAREDALLQVPAIFSLCSWLILFAICRQVELLEMRVETTLVKRALDDDDQFQPWSLRTEIRAWSRLFRPKHRDRTMIGVLIMVFQREFTCSTTSYFHRRENISASCRMEWH